ncbi:MAG: RuBisCO large subunit C-terminal-like domain-containing protein [Gemmatimonadota bacterium]
MPELRPVRARYRLLLSPGEDGDERASAIARDQSLEVPSGAATPEIEARLLGRVREVSPETPTPDAGSALHPTRVEVDYPAGLFDGSPTQFLNVVWGNVSLMERVRLEDLDVPDWCLRTFPGPGQGIPGLRRRLDAHDRPLVSSALKPVGLGTRELARLARTLTRAGVDVIKDDHGLADQGTAPFRERVQRVAEAVGEENGKCGGRTLYFPNVTAPAGEMEDRARRAREAGCGGVLVCPGLTGLDALPRLREAVPSLALMAHPSHADSAPGARRGIAPPLLMGTLWRLAGADCVIYVNARGRFAWPLETCLAINRRAREPLGGHLPAFPVPAGGIQASEVSAWFDAYGADTLLLIGGSILEAADVEGAARAVVEAAHAATDPGTGGRD